MELDRMRGDWAAKRLIVRQQWNRLTDEDLDAINGEREALLNVLEQRYDAPRERLGQQVSDFEDRLDSSENEVMAQAASELGNHTGVAAGYQDRALNEENKMTSNQQQGGPQQNKPSQGDKRNPEQNAGAGSMGNKQSDEETWNTKPGNQQGSKQNSQQGKPQDKQPSPQDSKDRSMASRQISPDEEDLGEESDSEKPSQLDSQSSSQADGSSKTDKQGQKGMKQPSGPPSWQRQSERRPEQPNR